eukprot:gene4693-biopygen5271
MLVLRSSGCALVLKLRVHIPNGSRCARSTASPRASHSNPSRRRSAPARSAPESLLCSLGFTAVARARSTSVSK